MTFWAYAALTFAIGFAVGVAWNEWERARAGSWQEACFPSLLPTVLSSYNRPTTDSSASGIGGVSLGSTRSVISLADSISTTRNSKVF